MAFERRVFRANALAIARAVLSNIRERFNCAFNWIDLTSPGQQHRRTRRPWPQPADGRHWSVQSGSRCTPMLVCAFVPVRSNLRGNISFLSNWPRTRAKRYRAPWVPRRPRISSGILSRLLAPERSHSPDASRLSVAPLLPFLSFFLRRVFIFDITSQKGRDALTGTLCAPWKLFPIHDCK